ncbi:MAG: ABC transporter ATP-binding protein [bacterium]
MSDYFIIRAVGIHRIFPSGGVELHVLRGIDIGLKKGEMVCLLGPSGSGKSTLLHILAGLDTPTDGRVFWADVDIFSLRDAQRSRMRNKQIGFVFQFHHLFPELTALENVMLPLLIMGVNTDKVRKRAMELLDIFRLGERASHFPSQLSGGEAQRVAVARAIVTGPEILLADEPSGNLDSENKGVLHNMLTEINREFGTTMLIATHNMELTTITRKVLYLKDGRVEEGKTSGGVLV